MNFPLQRKCKKCGSVLPDLKSLRTHYNEVHGGYAPKKKSSTVISNKSAYDQILDAERIIKDAVRGLEQERDIIQQKLLDLDSKIAKYKKLI